MFSEWLIELEKLSYVVTYRVHTGSGAHPASYSMGPGGSYPGDKASGAWSWPLTTV
jgi:hypothetical protein